MDHSGRGRGQGRGLFVRLTKGIAGVFTMCHSRAIEESVHRRRTEALREDFHHYIASMGHPLPPGSPPPPTPTYPENLNEWHQQEYGVPFVTPEDEAEEFDESFYTSAPPPPYPGSFILIRFSLW
ncbi:hypothetical protein ZEAMMB73_Zm00001d005103 [Zea mays]|uniref:Uncharacterized protein n=1 Tax=Zea mays TaxID=4577 RepID=A0A1D6EK49_MAIZE|nr:hypothetical protein ZEAMMB73_Zm00001d005103 [Zea mays]